MRVNPKSYPLNAADFQIKYLGKHPEYSNEQLYKVFAGPIIGFAETEAEAVQLIPFLRTW